MNAPVETVLAAAAAATALAAGALAFRMAAARRDEAARRRRRAQALGLDGPGNDGLPARIVRFIEAKGAPAPASGRRFPRARKRAAPRIEALVRHAGLQGRIDERMVRAAQRDLACLGGLAGAALGFALSVELGFMLGALGAAAGAACPLWALRGLEREREVDLERCLPEMLEVVALGLRSGLSFDRSFGLYGGHFPSSFGKACLSALNSWSLGLATREEALRALAGSYRSDQLGRTVERMVRSLRFGSALAPDLEQAAAEARARRRAQVEERVAKAPVKMMVPTGALILPAMLLLVMGPVLLELMQG